MNSVVLRLDICNHFLGLRNTKFVAYKKLHRRVEHRESKSNTIVFNANIRNTYNVLIQVRCTLNENFVK